MFENFNEVICLGMGGSYSEIAKDRLFKAYDLFMYQRSLNGIKECIEYVDENSNAVAVLPVETTYKGIIRETIDNLILTKNQNVQIMAETIIPVNDCILSKTTEFYSISGLIANPNALAKCKTFIRDEMPKQLNIVIAESMDDSARMLNNYNLTYAIIGTPKTAELYNLNILKEHIEDFKINNRRFIVIGDGETHRTGHDKTSIAETLSEGHSFRLTLDGIRHFEETANRHSSSHAFLAMWFGVEGNKVFRQSIEAGIKKAGYSLHVVDEAQYNGFIMDKVMNMINDAAFVIADLSAMPEVVDGEKVLNGVRGGVYWEAGYAAGQKKQVILTCHEGRESLKRIHFDLQQHNQIRWKISNGQAITSNGIDLAEAIEERVRATVGARNKVAL